MTKLEVFAAYLPHRIEVVREYNDGNSDHLMGLFYDGELGGLKIKLRPLSALQSPMQHPVTGEEIATPTEWIAEKFGDAITEEIVIAQLQDGFIENTLTDTTRQIDELAKELHFDIYDAIEKGWAVAI